ncbi:MAG: FHIPEP family type III secretion protein, partial [Polyangiaceae bacterium]
LGLEESLKRYGLLTIGDGLVTQIPALVLSTAAGLLVTRTASEDGAHSLGQDLARQLARTPRALAVAGGFVLLLAIVPGLPALPFLVLGLVLLGVARLRSNAQDVEIAEKRGSIHAEGFIPVVSAWSVDVSSDLSPLASKRDGAPLYDALDALRAETFAELGAPLPPPDIRVNEELPAGHAALLLQEVPAQLVKVTEKGTKAAVAAIVEAARVLVRARAADFVGIGETQKLLDELEAIAPATVKHVVPKPISVVTLSEVLKRLVDEQVSIKDLRAILEALAAAPLSRQTDPDPADLADVVRTRLRRPMTYALTRGARELDAWLLDPTIEETIRRAIVRTDTGTTLALSPAAARDIKNAVAAAIALNASKPARYALSDPRSKRVVIAAADVRRHVRKLVEVEFPDLRVIAATEILPEIIVKPIARISP